MVVVIRPLVSPSMDSFSFSLWSQVLYSPQLPRSSLIFLPSLSVWRPALKCLSLALSYRPPKTKFFFTITPQPIFLSPGITLTLPIAFRPLEEVRSARQALECEEGCRNRNFRTAHKTEHQGASCSTHTSHLL
jgi:hypothetical protein